MALTNYHIQVRYSESDNYKESPVSTADSIYFFVGEVEFKVICGEGVKYVILTSSEDDVTENGIKIRSVAKVNRHQVQLFPVTQN